MMMNTPRILVAGTGSGVGKTTLTLGIAAALTRRGLKVQTFKVGPDYLDPAWLSAASQRVCYNLDGWMSGKAYVEHLFARTAHDADIAVIEGVMGLFDGASTTDSSGSSAEIARWLKVPVLLTVNAHGLARSIAPMALGFSTFEEGVRVRGVIANQIGSPKHRKMLREALESTGQRLLGGVPRKDIPQLSSRYLGLMAPDLRKEEILSTLADIAEEHLDLEEILRMAEEAPPLSGGPVAQAPRPLKAALTLAVAKDDAFQFYYPDLFDALTARGWEIAFFSPISDPGVPEKADALYLGGGYPELFGEDLSRNRKMLQSIRDFADSKRPIYAECGGLIYLSGAITTREKRHPMVGLLPAETRMEGKCRRLGYVEARLREDSLWGKAGSVLRGHEFHYSEIAEETGPGWHSPYDATYRKNGEKTPEGFWDPRRRVLASYAHLHLASHPDALNHFTELCARQASERRREQGEKP